MIEFLFDKSISNSFSDLARERNQKNQKNKGHSASETEANKGLSLQERQSRDAAK
jgi:hypothetical protein